MHHGAEFLGELVEGAVGGLAADHVVHVSEQRDATRARRELAVSFFGDD